MLLADGEPYTSIESKLQCDRSYEDPPEMGRRFNCRWPPPEVSPFPYRSFSDSAAMIVSTIEMIQYRMTPFGSAIPFSGQES